MSSSASLEATSLKSTFETKTRPPPWSLWPTLRAKSPTWKAIRCQSSLQTDQGRSLPLSVSWTVSRLSQWTSL